MIQLQNKHQEKVKLCAPSRDSDQPAHPHSLIRRVLARRSSYGPNGSSYEDRSECVDVQPDRSFSLQIDMPSCTGLLIKVPNQKVILTFQPEHMLWVLKRTVTMRQFKLILTFQPAHMLWVLKRTVSMRRFFRAPKTNV